ncbi:MAG: thioredoxin-disulfide reductase [Alphaproteobacteria bacterium]|nr:thioredoxin-disulfide reductase [Alphaproteobacteria bacterium]
MAQYVAKIIILGSGPAGYTAAIYAARAGLNPCLISGFEVGGQLTMSANIENFPGFPLGISGAELMEKMRQQAINMGVTIINDKINEVDLLSSPFILSSENGNCFKTQSLIISTGASAKWLNYEAHKKYIGHGLSTCATCDGFFYKNKVVAVVGGGNSAAEEALYLTNFAAKVVLIHRRGELRADKILQQRLFDNPKVEFQWNNVIDEILGEKNVSAVVLKNVLTDEKKKLDVDGVFLAIGYKPNTDIFKKYLTCDVDGFIITKPNSTQTNIEGVFAAGDVKNSAYQQAVVAAGSGAMAAMEAQRYLSNTTQK